MILCEILPTFDPGPVSYIKCPCLWALLSGWLWSSGSEVSGSIPSLPEAGHFPFCMFIYVAVLWVCVCAYVVLTYTVSFCMGICCIYVCCEFVYVHMLYLRVLWVCVYVHILTCAVSLCICTCCIYMCCEFMYIHACICTYMWRPEDIRCCSLGVIHFWCSLLLVGSLLSRSAA